jgi:intracellular septation protein
MKLLFDFFPILLFFAAYKLFAGDIFIATLVTVAASAVQAAILWLRHRRIDRLQLATVGIVVLFGGATLLLHEEIYIKWKPTVVNWLFAVVFLGSHFIGERRPIIQRVLAGAIELPPAIWLRLNLAWSAFFVFLGLVNLVVVYNFTTAAWVNFKLFGILGLTVAFVALQSLYLSRHIRPDADARGKPE